jgi:hypothetical protein
MRITSLSRIGLIFSLSQFLFSANITGKITDITSGSFLPGANVYLSGTNYGAASDRSGDFTINNVPSGNYVLKVTYVGYADFSVDVSLGDESLTQDIRTGQSIESAT